MIVEAFTLSPIPGKTAEKIVLPQSPLSLDDISRQIPGGVYTTFRTYQKRYAISLSDHFERLENSASLSGQSITLDREWIRLQLRKVLEHFLSEEARVRISIDLTKKAGDVYFGVEELHTPSIEEYRQGVSIITQKMHRENPQAKATSFIQEAEKVRQQNDKKGINEILMISDDGHVLEGLSSNFFGILHGHIVTAKDGILPGITRKVVLDLANQLGIPVVYNNLRVGDISKLDEAFITSASRAVLPVTNIDGQPVRNGQVGEITRKLQTAFQKNLDASLDLI